MATAMYVSIRELPTVARAMRDLGYKVTLANLRANDRFVANIIERLEPMDVSAQVALERAIVHAVRCYRAR